MLSHVYLGKITKGEMCARNKGEIGRQDIDSLVNLINSAYRGVDGPGRWTTESHLVQGDRIKRDGLIAQIEDDDTDFIIGYLSDRVTACIAIKRFEDVVEFGTFAVDPELHANGYGGALLSYAESIAPENAILFQVSVVSKNTDLIAFYKRRGYQENGQKINYPAHLNVGKPKIDNLDLTILQKDVIRSEGK